MTESRVPPQRPSGKAAAIADTQVSPTADTQVALPKQVPPAPNAHVSPTADTQVAEPRRAPSPGTADTQLAPPAPRPAESPRPVAKVAAADAITLDASTVAPPSAPDFAPLPDTERYDVHGELARGGLGRILRATDRRLRRPVALKELLRRGGEAESRFLREAQVTASLQHPAIIPLYDVGKGEDGEPFFSMKLVSGRSLEEAIFDKRTLAGRLSLLPHVIDVAEAIAYAHSNRIIHRDLKPQNVLVGEFGETVVIDWGIAKDLSRGGADSGKASAGILRQEGPGQELTLDGAIVGTPAYMPPEQARGEPVDERADVYALGAILYHLLAGVPPHDDANLIAILRKLLASPPVPPVPLHERLSGVPSDLAAIVAKAMASNPADRYPSAKEIAADLQKFQTGQIVGAYRYSTTELVLRWLRRNRLVASLLTVLAVGGAVSIASIIDRSRIAEERRAHAEAAQAKAEAAETRERTRADEVTLEQARLSLDYDPQRSLDFLAALSPSFPRMSAARIVAADALSRELPRTLRGHQATIFGVAFSPDGKRLASASYDKTARIWDIETGTSHILEGHTGEVTHAVFSPDGTRIATASYDRTVRLWDSNTYRALSVREHAEWITALRFSADGKQLFTATAGGELRMSSTEPSSAQSRTFVGHTDRIASLDVSPDGTRLISLSEDGTARLWDVATGQAKVLRGSMEVLGIVAFSPRDDLLASTLEVPGVTLVDVRTGANRLLGSEGAGWQYLAFSPDGSKLAAADDANIVRVWDVASGKEIGVFRGHVGQVRALVFLPDNRHVLSGGDDQTVRVWDVQRGEGHVLRAHSGPVTCVAVSQDGSKIASGSQDTTVRLWTPARDRGLIATFQDSPSDIGLLRNGRLLVVLDTPDVKSCAMEYNPCDSLPGHAAKVTRIAVSPGGEIAATASDDGTVRLWDASSYPEKALRTLVGHEGPVRDVVFLPDGKHIVSSGADATIRMWEVETGEGRVLATQQEAGVRLSISPDGAQLVARGRGRTAHLLDIATASSRTLAGHASLIMGLSFAPDGKLAATASLDRTLRLWDTRTGEARVLESNDGGLYTAAFAPQGGAVVTGSDGAIVRIWDIATGESRALRAHTSAVRGVVISPDGRTIATASTDGTARLWDMATGESRALRGHQLPVRRAIFSPDGKRVFTFGEDGTVRVWTDDLPHDEVALTARISALATPTVPSP